MKKLFYLVVIALVSSLSVSFSACSSDDDESTELNNDSTEVASDSLNVNPDSTEVISDSTALVGDSTYTE